MPVSSSSQQECEASRPVGCCQLNSKTPSILRYGAELPPERRNAHSAGPLPSPQVPAGRHPGGVWLYFRFTLSFREVEEMLAQRGIEASYETVRCWALKFGQAFARNLRRSRPKPTGRWHVGEMVVKIRGERMWLWRAVDDEGEVLDMLVQKRRNTGAALRLLLKLLKRNGVHPESFTTNKLDTYPGPGLPPTLATPPGRARARPERIEKESQQDRKRVARRGRRRACRRAPCGVCINPKAVLAWRRDH
jgi:transposase-like protein